MSDFDIIDFFENNRLLLLACRELGYPRSTIRRRIEEGDLRQYHQPLEMWIKCWQMGEDERRAINADKNTQKA